jgi:hypothetical protein
MDDAAYHWGHNQPRTGAGHMNLDFITFNINPSTHAQYKEVADTIPALDAWRKSYGHGHAE